MTDLEEQLSALLKEAPGEPPAALNPDALASRAQESRPHRRRWVAPALAAAAVVAVAVPAAVVVHGSSGKSPAVDHSRQQPARTKQAAINVANSALAQVAVLPGAARVGGRPTTSLTRLISSIEAPRYPRSAGVVERAADWTAPGTVSAAATYFTTHAPSGIALQDGHISYTTQLAGHRTWTAVELDGRQGTAWKYTQLRYFIVPYRTGVAVEAQLSVAWGPRL